MSFSPASLCSVLEAHTPAAAQGFVVAISGGTDSACLLAALRASAATFRELPIRAVHVDHGLQDAAADFREACQALCRRLSVPLTILKVTVAHGRGQSLEAAAREARYRALGTELAAEECLLTAHHADDQAETLLLQLLRGSGMKGVSAMPMSRRWCNGWHLRPLLNVPRRELHRFGAESAVLGVPDPMNTDRRFDRAYVRGELWPLIEARWPGAAIALSRAAGHFAQAQELLDQSAAATVQRLRDGRSLSVPALRALTPAEQRNALRHWILAAGVPVPSSARLGEGLRQILSADVDQVPLIAWDVHALRRYQDRLFLTAREPPRLGEPREWRPDAEGVIDLGPNLGRLERTWQRGGLDAQRLPQALTVRQRRGGERLKPQARARTQSLQHLCQAFGVVPWMRDALPLVYAGDDLVAVGDLWRDARWCVAASESGMGFDWREAPALI